MQVRVYSDFRAASIIKDLFSRANHVITFKRGQCTVT